MASPNQPPVRRPPGFWPLIGVLALLAAIKPLAVDTLDPDLFWHMRVADQLLSQGIGPLIDNFSYASSAKPWTPYSWLAELAMRQLWQIGGYRATLLTHVMLLAGIVLFAGAMARQSIEQSMTRCWAAAAVATAAMFPLLIPWLGFRPSTFAIFFLAMIGWLLHRDRRLNDQTRAVWCTLPLTALVANLHMFVFLSPILMATHAAGAIWQQRTACEMERSISRLRLRRRLLLLGLSLAACCATPMLPGMIQATAYYGMSDPMVAANLIIEMQPLYYGTFGKVILVLLTGLLLILLRGRQHLNIADWLVVGGGTLAAAQHGRFATLLALCALPLVTLSATDLTDRWLFRPALVRLLYGLLALGSLTLYLLMPPANQTMEQWVNRRGPQYAGFPCEAADFVARRVPATHGRLINEFAWGGYLGWRLGDRFKVLVDGRIPVYPDEFWAATYLGTDQQRQDYLARIQADAAVLPQQGSLFQSTLLQLGWRTAYSDARAMVLIPPE